MIITSRSSSWLFNFWLPFDFNQYFSFPSCLDLLRSLSISLHIFPHFLLRTFPYQFGNCFCFVGSSVAVRFVRTFHLDSWALNCLCTHWHTRTHTQAHLSVASLMWYCAGNPIRQLIPRLNWKFQDGNWANSIIMYSLPCHTHTGERLSPLCSIKFHRGPLCSRMTDLNSFACLGRHCSPAAYTIYRQSVSAVCVCWVLYYICVFIYLRDRVQCAHVTADQCVAWSALPSGLEGRGGAALAAFCSGLVTLHCSEPWPVFVTRIYCGPSHELWTCTGIGSGRRCVKLKACCRFLHSFAHGLATETLETDMGCRRTQTGSLSSLAQPCFVATAAGHLQ